MFTRDASVLICLYLLLVPVTGLGGDDGGRAEERGFSPRDTPLRRALARSRIVPRQADPDSCLTPDDTPCSRGYPSKFCCQKGETCMSLAGHTTAVCCPEGSSCRSLYPISCNISLQDVTANPGAAVVTTELNTPLPRCAEGCCPFGYTCDSATASFCVRNEDQSKFVAPAGSSSSIGRPTPTISGVFVKTSTAVTTQTTTTGSSSTSESTGTTTAAPASSETASPANGTAAAAAPPSAPSSQVVAVAVGTSLGAFAMVGGLLAAAYLKRGKLSAMTSSVAAAAAAAARRNRSRRIPAPFWAANSNNNGNSSSSSSHHHHGYFNFGWGGQHSPPPPPYPYADQQPLHLSLDQCKRIPRRKTVPSRRRAEMAAAAAPAAVASMPVELPATPVPWAAAPSAASAVRSSRGSETFLPRRSRAAAESFFLPWRLGAGADDAGGGGDRRTSFKMHPRTGTNSSFSRPFYQAQPPPRQQQQQQQPTPEPLAPPPSAWPRPLRLNRRNEQSFI